MQEQQTPDNQQQIKSAKAIIGSVKRKPLIAMKKSKPADELDDKSDTNNQGRRLLGNKKANILLVVVLVLFSAWVSAIFITKNIKTNNKPPQVTISEDKQRKLLQLNNNVSQKINNGDYDGAMSEIKNNKDFVNTAEGYNAEYLVFMNQKKYQEAVAVMLQAEQKFGMSYSLAHSLGLAYERLGDKTNAIRYYTIYSDLLQKADLYPLKEADLKNTREKIESLKQ